MKEQKKKHLFTNKAVGCAADSTGFGSAFEFVYGDGGHADRQQYRVGGYFGGIPGGRNQYPGCGSVSGLGGWRYGRLFSVSWKQRRGEGK